MHGTERFRDPYAGIKETNARWIAFLTDMPPVGAVNDAQRLESHP